MKLRLFLILTAILTMGAKCTDVDVTDPNVAATLTELNTAWREGYREMLNDIGTRRFNVKRPDAFNGMKKTLEELGFKEVLSEGDYYLNVTIPAANMFTEQEWRRVRQSDEPGARRIVAKHLGLKGNFFSLEPEGLLIEGKITLLEAGNGTDITITFRLREISPMPPESVLPRRDYPPPYSARVGFEKIWNHFEQLTLPVASLGKTN
jgi:hypothetical protein